MCQIVAFATDVPPDIYGFHSYTWNSATLSRIPVMQYQGQFHGWAVAFHPWLTQQPTCALRPVIPINARTLRITAAAGTELAGASFAGTVNSLLISTVTVLPCWQRFTIRRPSSLTRRRCVRLSPIAQYSPLLPPVGVWTVFQFQCDWSSSQTS